MLNCFNMYFNNHIIYCCNVLMTILQEFLHRDICNILLKEVNYNAKTTFYCYFGGTICHFLTYGAKFAQEGKQTI